MISAASRTTAAFAVSNELFSDETYQSDRQFYDVDRFVAEMALWQQRVQI
jgi:hypothetical protein